MVSGKYISDRERMNNAILKMRESGMARKDIAEFFGLSGTAIGSREALAYRWRQEMLDSVSNPDSIYHLGLSVRTCNCLWNSSINTIYLLRKVLKENPQYFVGIKNLGLKGYIEIQRKLSDRE